MAQATSCCGPTSTPKLRYADALYGTEDLAGLPDTVVEASAGCGNPTAVAALQPGETVLDLGSGGGIDVFIAAKKVGPAGRAIGVDMTPEMIRLARENAKKVGASNVEFRLGELEHMPVETGTVDAIISNCVINLSPDKDAVFAEAYRVLKPGGRLSVSDIVVDQALPADIRASFEAWAGCVAGALEESVYLDKIRDAGFADVQIDSAVDMVLKGVTVTSLKVKARKPA